jgi:FkbM family methyltransferase
MRFFSQSSEDQFIYENFFSGPMSRQGVYLEMGALDGSLYSNTRFFEVQLGWTGILIEPNPTQFKRLCKNRPNNKNYNELISDMEGEVDYQYFQDVHAAVSGITDTLPTKHYATYFDKFSDLAQGVVKMQPKKLTDIIANSGFEYIDFFSLDVEGHELNVLNSFDFKVPVGVLMIERLDDSISYNRCSDLLLNMGFEYFGSIAHNEVFVNRAHKFP